MRTCGLLTKTFICSLEFSKALKAVPTSLKAIKTVQETKGVLVHSATEQMVELQLSSLLKSGQTGLCAAGPLTDDRLH